MASAKTSSVVSVMALLIIAGGWQRASAVRHTVDWTFTPFIGFFDEWASQQTFLKGDEILFVYPSTHDVYEVSRLDFESCNASKPIKVYNATSKDALVPLSRVGYYAFICSIDCHCHDGFMKMSLTVQLTAPSIPLAILSSSATAPGSEVSPQTGSSLQIPPTIVLTVLWASFAAFML